MDILICRQNTHPLKYIKFKNHKSYFLTTVCFSPWTGFLCIISQLRGHVSSFSSYRWLKLNIWGIAKIQNTLFSWRYLFYVTLLMKYGGDLILVLSPLTCRAVHTLEMRSEANFLNWVQPTGLSFLDLQIFSRSPSCFKCMIFVLPLCHTDVCTWPMKRLTKAKGFDGNILVSLIPFPSQAWWQTVTCWIEQFFQLKTKSFVAIRLYQSLIYNRHHGKLLTTNNTIYQLLH